MDISHQTLKLVTNRFRVIFPLKKQERGHRRGLVSQEKTIGKRLKTPPPEVLKIGDSFQLSPPEVMKIGDCFLFFIYKFKTSENG